MLLGKESWQTTGQKILSIKSVPTASISSSYWIVVAGLPPARMLTVDLKNCWRMRLFAFFLNTNMKVLTATAFANYWSDYLPTNTVDGRYPAPVDMLNIPLFTRCYTSQVVQDFFHQPYHSRLIPHVTIHTPCHPIEGWKPWTAKWMSTESNGSFPKA